MRIFLDTANIDEIRDVARLGVLSGVTTNPTLMAKEGSVPYRDRVIEICQVVQGPVSAECTARDLPGLLEEARSVAGWNQHVVVKVPMDATGLEATSILSKEGIKVNMTLVFSANQAALAGAHIATLPYSVFQLMLKHPLTDVGIERFLADSRKYAMA